MNEDRSKTESCTRTKYSYDAVGSRLSSLGVSPYSYNTSNELTSTPSGSFTYDYNGNTLTDATGRSYTWDYENRLTQVTMPNSGGTATFKYDPFGRRVQKVFTTGGNNPTTTTTNYLYDGDNVVETVDQNGNVLTKFAQGQNIDEPLAESVGGANYDYEQDGLGSVTSLTSSTGALSLTYTYDSFGKITNSQGAVSNPFEYTGRDYDPETGLYYYRARYYDPTVGRFASEDPLGLRIGVNRFQYVANDPLNFADPSGLCKISVGQHVVITLVPTCGPPIKLEHTYIVLGDKNKGDRWVFDSEAHGWICPWCKPTLVAAAGLLAPGLQETNMVDADGIPLQVTQDDGRPCQLDYRILDDFANRLNAAGVPYHLLGPNSNSATSAGLSALGINGWAPPIIAPGWGIPLPIPK
jgi:RHS repeat-associated protein